MAEAKVLIFIANLLGVPLWGYILLNYWGDFESLVMLVLGSVFASVKIAQAVVNLVFSYRKNKQDARMRDLKIEEKEREMNGE